MQTLAQAATTQALAAQGLIETRAVPDEATAEALALKTLPERPRA